MEYGFAPILLDRVVCRDFERSSRLEWLESNTTGGYAMGTVAGLNTRRYHGLLVSALDPPTMRYVMLSSLEEEVEIDGQTYQISTHQFKDGLHGKGYELLDLFRLDPFPAWEWTLGPNTFTKRLFLVKGKPAAIVQYICEKSCTVRVRPLLAFRDYHNLMQVNDLLNDNIERARDHFRMTPYPGLPSLTVYFGDKASFTPAGEWKRGFDYFMETERGMDAQEDLFCPGEIALHVDGGNVGWIAADLTGEDGYDEHKVKDLTEQYRNKQVVGNTPFEARLTAAADQFRAFRRDGRPTLLAGFPWFASWGRDAMVGLPGLVITRGFFDEAKGILEGFLMHLNQGLIPNHFPNIGAPTYNTIDATLWMFQAVWSYVQCGGGMEWVKNVFYPVAKTIITWHERGTLYEIHVDPEDGLLAGGVEGTMLTWMDAKVGDWVVTPRRGKPIEVNALWYNALRIMLHWATELEDLEYGHKIREMAKRAQSGFQKFWNPTLNCCYDVIEEDGALDDKIRPNQVIAASLPFPLLDEKQRQAVMLLAKEKLLTPVGLRSLSPDDPDYRPRYEGDRHKRDGAYHNGTVWAWLIGPYITGYLRAFGKSTENIAYCRGLVDNFEPQVLTFGLGSIAEIFDGDPPHCPRGCVAQAWSVAELLRVLRSELA